MARISPGKSTVCSTQIFFLIEIDRSLILHEVSKGEKLETLLHLRFRGKIAATGLKKRLLVSGGGMMDHLTTAPMLAGLAERAEAEWADRSKNSK